MSATPAVGPAVVRAAGGVLWRTDETGTVVVAVVHRPKYDDWSLPKGKLEVGEGWLAGAVREVHEETGVRALAGRSLGTTSYRVLDRGRDAPKTVRWWALRAVDGEFAPNREVDELRWLPAGRATALLTTRADAGVLRAFCAAPAATTSVLLVRHASAGDASTWAGDDDDRPLDARGREQAQALSRLLPLWGPEQLLTAPPLRCVQTLEPLARAQDVEPVVDGQLGEAAAPALLGRLRELAAAGRPVVACSQGGVIPVAVLAIAREAGLDVGPVRADKGSVWALSFAAGELVGAEHVEDPLA